jgi:hypothetical protein
VGSIDYHIDQVSNMMHSQDPSVADRRKVNLAAGNGPRMAGSLDAGASGIRTHRRLGLPGLAVLAVLSASQVASAQDAATGAGAEAAVDEPSEAQIHAAYAAALADLNARTIANLGVGGAPALTIELEELNKLGCRGLDRPGVHFDCRVERRIRRGERRPTTDVVELWLSYQDARWVAR